MSDEEATLPPKRRETDLPPDAPWYARWFVANVKAFYKWLSTWLIAVAAAAPLLYENLPELQKELSPTLYHYLQTALVLSIFLARIKRQ